MQMETTWQELIQPRVDELSHYIRSRINQQDETQCTFWNTCVTASVYTTFYNITTSHDFSYQYLEYFIKKEFSSIELFCSSFTINNLDDLLIHVTGFELYIKWFKCFFHHLNRYYNKVTSYNLHDLHYPIETCYLRPQLHMIESLLIERLLYIRNNDYPLNNLDKIMEILTKYHSIKKKINLLFTTETTKFYKNIVQVYYKENNSNHLFIQKCIYYLKNEKQIGIKYIKTFNLLFIEHIITPTFNSILTEWINILDTENIQDISLYYEYLKLGNRNDLILNYKKYIENKLSTIRQLSEIIHIYNYNTKWIKQILVEEKNKFIDVLNKTMINLFKQNTSIGETIVRKIDSYIKKKIVNCDVLIELLKFCSDHELIQHQYRNYLRERLLIDPCIKREKLMLNMLKSQLGNTFVLNMTTMINEIQTNYNQMSKICMYTLSRVIWGFDTNLKYKAPIQHELEKMIPCEQNKKYELTMAYGSVIIKSSYKGKEKNIIMSPVQAIVLLTIQDKPCSYNELVNILDIPDDNIHNLVGVLKSLSSIIIEQNGQWMINTHYIPTNSILPPIQKQHQVETSNASII